MLNPRNATGRWYRDKLHRKKPGVADQDLEGSWTRAQRWVADHPAGTDLATLTAHMVQVQDFVADHGHRFKGAGGINERLAVLALTELVITKAHREEFQISTRQLAEIIGCKQPAAGKTLNRLSNAGDLLQLVARGRGAEAATYRFRKDPVCTACDGGGLKAPATYTTGEVPDLFARPTPTRPTLGPTAWTLYCILGTTPGLNRTDLMQISGHCKQTVENALTRLESAGLVTGTADEWHVTETTVEQVTEALCIPRLRQAKQTDHRRHREVFDQKRADKKREKDLERLARQPAA